MWVGLWKSNTTRNAAFFSSHTPEMSIARVIVMYDENEPSKKTITLGLFKGKIQMSEDFNEPLPDSF